MPENRAAVVRSENVADVEPRVEVPRPIGVPRLDESRETAVRRVGVPDVEPVAGFVEVMDHVGRLAETLCNEPDTEVVI